jgi:hypothetical protein
MKAAPAGYVRKGRMTSLQLDGYPLKAGHPLTSMTECNLTFSSPRLRQGLDVG